MKGDSIKKIIDSVLCLDVEAAMSFDKDGAKIRIIDPATVALLFIDIPVSSFNSFESDDCNIAVDFGRISEYINKENDVKIEIDNETHRMNIENGKSKYNVALLDLTAIKKPPTIKQLEFNSSIIINSADFKNSINSSSKINDELDIIQKDNKLSFRAKGDMDSCITELQEEIEIIKNADSIGTYRIDYLNSIMKTFSKYDKIRLDMGNNYPLSISYNFNGIDIKFLVAPRVEEAS
jgi:proliferating cell nuclear antigen